MKNKAFIYFTTLFGFISLILIFQNCAPLGKSFQVGADSYTSSAVAVDVCIKSSSNACIFLKSAVDSANAPITDYLLGAYIFKGIIFYDLDSSGYLQNNFISIQTTATERKNPSALKEYPSSTSSAIEQAMAYYNLNSAVKFYSSLGTWSATQTQLSVIVDSNYNGYNSSSHSIHLKKGLQTRPTAYDSSIIIFLLNEANAYKATNGNILTSISSTSSDCNNTSNITQPNGCCISQDGCGAALYLAQADYLTAVYFQAHGFSTSIAETYVNKPAGASACGISRNPANNAGTTLSTAYNACASKGLNPAMAAVYSSIWWEVRKKLSSTDQQSLDQLFLTHVAQLTGSMNFTDAIQAAITIDTNSYSGKFGTLLTNELARRKN